MAIFHKRNIIIGLMVLLCCVSGYTEPIRITVTHKGGIKDSIYCAIDSTSHNSPTVFRIKTNKANSRIDAKHTKTNHITTISTKNDSIAKKKYENENLIEQKNQENFLSQSIGIIKFFSIIALGTFVINIVLWLIAIIFLKPSKKKLNDE